MATKLSEINEYQRYYLDGFYEGRFIETESFLSFKQSLQDICNENLDEGFSILEGNVPCIKS